MRIVARKEVSELTTKPAVVEEADGEPGTIANMSISYSKANATIQNQ